MIKTKRRCTHRRLVLKTERDRCTWVKCKDCKKQGPRKHSQTLALLAWIVALANQHPRPRTIDRTARSASSRPRSTSGSRGDADTGWGGFPLP